MWAMQWQKLAQAVIDRRVELGHRTREAFAEATGLSRRLLSDIERARRDNYDRVTFARLEQALEWRSGRVLDILRDDDPSTDDESYEVLVGEVARLLDRGSPLPTHERRWFAGVLDLLAGRYRRRGVNSADRAT